MAAFAIASAGGLLLAPWIWQRVGRAGAAGAERWTARAAGLLLACTSLWALGHGLWIRVIEYCLPP